MTKAKKTNNVKITKNDIISDIIERYPESVETFMEYGLGCVGCGIASFETIEEGCHAHGFSENDINMLVKDLNDINS